MDRARSSFFSQPGCAGRAGFGGLAGFLVALAGAGCGDEPGHPAPAPGALETRAVRFEPAERDHADLAVGEVRVEQVELCAEKPFDWKKVSLASSCDCLSGQFIGEPTPTRAVVEVSLFGHEIEDIDGVIMLQDLQQNTLAEYVAHIDIRRRPFVQPHVVECAGGGSGRFEITLGQAFALDATLPPGLLEDFGEWDETKVILIDQPESRETAEEHVLLKCTLQFEMQEAARASAFELEIPVKFGVPAVERRIPVHYRGPAGAAPGAGKPPDGRTPGSGNGRSH